MVLILLVTDIFSVVAIQSYVMIYSTDNKQKLYRHFNFYFYQALIAFMKDGICVIDHWSPAKNLESLCCPALASNEPFSSL